jgi:NitT/TauT family transport system permease protein
MKENTLKLLGFLTVISAWHVSSLFIPLPPPHLVAIKFLEILYYPEPVLGRNLTQHAVSSILRVVSGSLIAFMVAIPLGIVIGWNNKLDSYFTAMIEVFRPIPPLAWIPLAYIFFSVLSNPVQFAQVFIVFVGAFFPCVLSVREFAKSTDRNLIEMAKVFGAGDRDILVKVVIPNSIPGILSGVRIGLGVGWMSIVAAEMLASSGSGLGYFIMVMYEVGGRVEEIISGIIAIGIIGFLMNEILLRVERRLLRWR